jgi:hypothetical protein
VPLAQSNSGNVLSKDPARAGRSRLTPLESVQELNECRSIVLERLAVALGAMLDNVDGELYDKAGRAPDRDSREGFLDARAEARARRSLVEATFREHFIEIFNRKVLGEFPPRGVAHPPQEAGGEVLCMWRRLQRACEAELGPLGQRMRILTPRASAGEEGNPVGPATACAALEQACRQLAGLAARTALLRQLELRAEAELCGIYRDLNRHLADRRILPEAAAAPPGDATQPLEPLGGQPGSGDAFALLAQLRRDARGAPPPPTDAAIEALTRAHRGCASISSGTLVNELRPLPAMLREDGCAIDAVMLDLCATLFDHVFADRQLPTALKSQMGRLQLPFLKAVLLDPSFFSRRAHPARRLLDTLAELGLGMLGDGPKAGAALDLVEDMGDRILATFERDLAVFDAMTAVARTFMAANEEADARLVRRVAPILEARERVQMATEAGRLEVQRRLAARAWVPAALREMLLETWSCAFAGVYGVEGESSPPWQELARLLDELLWSVQPKVAPEDRRRLVATLPALLEDVSEALQRAQVSPGRRDAFFAALVDCHALAVRAGVRGLTVVPEFPAPPPASRAARIERQVLESGDVRVEEIRLSAPPGGPAPDALARTGECWQVQRGSWIEFSEAGARGPRLRLAWVSPGKSAHLFTNPLTGDAPRSISPQALAEQMSEGHARALDSAPLVGRAMDAMVAALRGRRAAARSPSP